MSAKSHTTGHDTGHTGPIKLSKQLVLTVLFSFVLPVAMIASLVSYVNSGDHHGASGVNSEKSTAARIQKVGEVGFQSASRELKTGEQVFTAQCSACHATGAAGSPKFGNAVAWGPRIQTGFNALLNSALKGKNAMAPQGGGAFSDLEVARAVVYMANAGGAKFPEPKAGGAAK
jgi:cytochrome c5